MGCCFSTNNSTLPPKTTKKSNSKTTGKQSSISKSPPPTNPLPEEETVKEVLSETPTVSKNPSPFIPKVQESHQNESPFIRAAPLLPDFGRIGREKKYQNGGVGKKQFVGYSNDDLSEDVSEICSTLSESISVSTTVTEKRENNGEQNHELREFRQRSPARVKKGSFSGEGKREKTVGRSPGRKSEPSPSRVRPGSGSVHGRRRDSGESSGRRSRSPVMRMETGLSKTGLGRSPSARKTGKSPGRVGSGLGERIRKLDEGKENGDKWLPTSNESLENPLVSLECFIFL
ncbi:hypothetical protein CDL12_28584 [Handroanthus impetiginosus]|uniref:Uncharacterized protein n=1 Tax=Handroanthus impetiginosus TaxID=429701 RepID=A0A2G9G0S1_9LAMI|nr:hypothetical protein CDL12_28584 [Handroanthus impetiginosus]